MDRKGRGFSVIGALAGFFVAMYSLLALPEGLHAAGLPEITAKADAALRAGLPLEDAIREALSAAIESGVDPGALAQPLCLSLFNASVAIGKNPANLPVQIITVFTGVCVRMGVDPIRMAGEAIMGVRAAAAVHGVQMAAVQPQIQAAVAAILGASPEIGQQVVQTVQAAFSAPLPPVVVPPPVGAGQAPPGSQEPDAGQNQPPKNNPPGTGAPGTGVPVIYDPQASRY